MSSATYKKEMDSSVKRILVIDDRPEELAAVLKFCARSKWSDVEVETYHPGQGMPGTHFDWGAYDLLALGLDFGMKHHNGLVWLKALHERVALPPAVIMADVVNERLRELVREAGAEAVIDKLELSPTKFHEIVELIGPTTRVDSAAVDDLEATRISPNAVEDALSFEGESIPDHEKPPGDIRIPGYRLIRKLKGSGIAQIFVAEQLDGGNRVVVLKVLSLVHSVDEIMVRRLIREHQYIERIEHSSVIDVYETGSTRDYAYIAMEYCPHGTLVEQIEKGLSPEESINFIRQIAAGLGAVHMQGISHRDVKPANCLLRTPKRAVLADFGIAKNELTVQALTGENDFFGTLFYTSPEQLKGAEGDSRGDMYSLGIMMYQMLSGSLPYASKGLRSLINAHINEPLERLPEGVAQYQDIVDGLTRKDPEMRTQTTNDLLAALDALAPN